MKALRSALRARRAALAPEEVASHSLAIARHLWRLPMLARARRLACYVAHRGEVDCMPIVTAAVARGREVFLPVLHGRSLTFARWRPGEPLAMNRYGIPEPVSEGARRSSGRDLDIVLAPLVAFDDAGHRLGMGGGYYDRTMRVLATRGAWQRPYFIGLAHAFQRVAALPAQRWDIALHAVVTEHGAQIF